jgi:hypothetical protein
MKKMLSQYRRPAISPEIKAAMDLHLKQAGLEDDLIKRLQVESSL